MIDQEMNLPVADRSDGLDRMARPAAIGQTIAAIIAITKSKWMSKEQASPALDEMAADRTRFAHPPFGIALDAERTGC